MAANVRTDMRIPTRTAPRPPSSGLAFSRNGTWGSDQFINGSFLAHPPQKKKPPPRPPPPKFTHQQYQYERSQRSKKPARPTELITNIFGRKTTKQPPSVSHSNNRPGSSSSQSSSTPSGMVSLIDLSPPGSPTLTTRSNSDGLSVDSFGSDGNSNPSVFTSSGNTSQAESGFEDDFDFFGGLSSQKITPNDPWKLNSNQDPFSPSLINTSSNITKSSLSMSKTVGNTDFFAFNEEYNSTNQSQTSFSIPNSKPVSNMPTIIRAKPAKPPAPKFAQTNLAPTVTQFHPKPVPMKRTTVPYNEPVTLDVNDAWNDSYEEPSPPMPSIPPPAPPPQYLAEEHCQQSYGIALYDFPATQPNDLPLKEGDVVILVKVVNSDWIEGRVGNRQGIFPINFVDVKVPLTGLPTNTVNALYAFEGETSEDLTFQDGAKITVLSKLSEDWLYGESDGRRGQFPANYVDRIPSDLP